MWQYGKIEKKEYKVEKRMTTGLRSGREEIEEALILKLENLKS